MKLGDLGIPSRGAIAVHAPVMSEPGEIDLSAPVAADTILEVRSGKMKNLQGLSILSGIDKTLCSGSVAVTAEGIVGDEHDYTVRTTTP